ncbi:hypothetical protein ACFLQY_04060 [Verrucomicrobiota bacterium]
MPNAIAARAMKSVSPAFFRVDFIFYKPNVKGEPFGNQTLAESTSVVQIGSMF